MRYTFFLLCFILNGCWYSNGCFYTPQMVNCVDKGKLWPAIAHYQKPYSIGKTDQQQRWKDAVSCGAEYGDNNLKQAITSLKKIPYLSVRVNKLKYSEEEFEEFLKEKDIQIIKKVDSVYYVNSGLIINSKEFKEGKIIAQDASSYLAAKNLDAMPNELVLDICAAPGGKTAVLAENMKNMGEIIAIDIHQHKIKLIDTNMKKLGIDIVKAVVMDARNVNKQGRKFDKILVDVPCSGYGVIRKKPEILYSKNRENIEELAKLQLEILNSAADILKDGGELIYSTCTIISQENTENVEKFLNERKEFKVKALNIPENVKSHQFMDKRAEELSVEDFINFTIEWKNSM